MIKLSMSETKLYELTKLFYVGPFGAYIDNMWFDQKNNSYKTSEHTVEVFSDHIERIKNCSLGQFLSWSTTSYYNKKVFKISHKQKHFKAVLVKGKRMITRKELYVSLTMNLETGRMMYYQQNGKYKTIRNFISTSTFTGANLKHLFVSNTAVLVFKTIDLMVGDVKWIKGLMMPLTLEDIVKTDGNPKSYMLRRFKKNVPFPYLYHNCKWLVENYSYSELFTILQFVNLEKSISGYQYGKEDFNVLSDYWIARYNINGISASDYYNMCRDLAIKPQLKFENKAHFENNHIRIALKYKVRDITFNIPKGIPDIIINGQMKLKLIKTGLDLYKEGVLMSHCVNTYANDVEDNKSFIYKGYIKNTRITLELKQNKIINKRYLYCLSQVKGKKDINDINIFDYAFNYFSKYKIFVDQDLVKNSFINSDNLPF